MSEFNGNKFYGYPLHNDPSLSTTTRNFEFRYTRPELLERVIQKVHQDKAAVLPKICKVKKPENIEVSGTFRTRDVDVETQVSKEDMRRIRRLSDTEVENLIGRAKSNLQQFGARSGDQQATTSVRKVEQRVLESATVEEIRLPLPQWVEIVEQPTTETLLCENMVGSVEENNPLTSSYNAMLYYNAPTYDNVVEDSDLEYELQGREEYMKLCEPRPCEEDMLNLADDGSVPQFVEMESPPRSTMTSFLKNTSPMHFSDGLTDTPSEDHAASTQMRVVIRNRKGDKGQGDSNSAISKPSNVKEHKGAVKNKKPAASTKSKKQRTVMSPSTRQAKPLIKECSPPQNAPITPRTQVQQLQEQQRNAWKARLMASQFDTHGYKSPAHSPRSGGAGQWLIPHIEHLKMEKMAIFSKMSTTQERIIEILDKLRYSLLEVHLADSGSEKTKRQKNAFEFVVRFSRNFLYPLKGMIEDLRAIPIAKLNSATSNDSCQRVSSIYSLIYQSLQTYQKQLRYFVLDQVPQKLAALIDLIQIVTVICLEKGVFDRQDNIVDCLQDRCCKFTALLENKHDEHFFNAQDYAKKPRNEVPPSQYDLKMFMNNLNMYEPKLVPKKGAKPRTIHKKLGKKSARGVDQDSDLLDTRCPVGDEVVPTHLEAASSLRSSTDMVCDWQSLLTQSTNQFLKSNKTSEQLINCGLDHAIVEALQTVTKEQVRQVMQPIIQSLGSALDKKKNSETIEAILSAFNPKMDYLARNDKRSNSKVLAERARGGTTNSTGVGAEQEQTANASKTSKVARRTKPKRRQKSHKAAAATAGPKTTTAATTAQQQQQAEHQPQQAQQQRTDDDVFADDDDGKLGSVYGGDDDDDDASSTGDSSSTTESDVLVNARQKRSYTKYSSSKRSKRRQRYVDANYRQIGDSDDLDDNDHSDDYAAYASSDRASIETEAEYEPDEDDEAAEVERRVQYAFELEQRMQKRHVSPCAVVLNDDEEVCDAINTGQTASERGDDTAEDEEAAEEQPQCNINVTLTKKSLTKKQQLEQQKREQQAALHQQKLMDQQKHHKRQHSSRRNGATPALAQMPPLISKRTAAQGVNRHLFKKRHDPLRPSPPAPSVTPLNSARSAQKSDDKLKAELALDKVTSGMSQGDTHNSANLQHPNQTRQHFRRKQTTAGGDADNMLPEEQSDITAQRIVSDDLKTKEGLSPSTGAVHKRKALKKNASDSLAPLSGEDMQFNFSPHGCPVKQLQKLQKLQHELQLQERKQRDQLRALSKLNEATQKCAEKEKLYAQQQIGDNSGNDRARYLNNIEGMLRERNQFLESCRHNRFYANPNYDEPWKIFSQISEKLANEVVGAVEEDFTVGVSKFIEDFLALEIKP